MNKQPSDKSEDEQDSAADTKVVVIVFATLVVLALHLISGFTIDL